MISAIPAVSALLTVTSTTPASLKIEGSSDSVSWFGAIRPLKPSKLVSRSPLPSISLDHARARQQRDAGGRPAAHMPPTKQPMLPAPAMPIELSGIMSPFRSSSSRFR